MRKSGFLLVAALAATTILAAGAGAQDTTVAKGEVARAPSASTLVSAVNLTPTTVEALKARAEIKESEIKFIDAAPLIDAQADSALKAALEKHAASLEQVRSILGAQPVVGGVLAKQAPKATLADVIAVELHADGSMDIYYKSKGS